MSTPLPPRHRCLSVAAFISGRRRHLPVITSSSEETEIAIGGGDGGSARGRMEDAVQALLMGLGEDSGKSRWLKLIAQESDRPDLGNAPIVVTGGRGLKRAENFKSLDKLTEKLGAADMGDSYVELIANGSKESMLIVHALLEVASHPDYDISSMAYNFWHHLQLNLILSNKLNTCLINKNDNHIDHRYWYASFGSDALIEEERNRRLYIFSFSI